LLLIAVARNALYHVFLRPEALNHPGYKLVRLRAANA
jgi:hypothetical protein